MAYRKPQSHHLGVIKEIGHLLPDFKRRDFGYAENPFFGDHPILLP